MAICGSSFCTLEVLAITKGALLVLVLEFEFADVLPLELQAARPILSATRAAAGAPRRDSEARGMFPPGGGGARGRQFGRAYRSWDPGQAHGPRARRVGCKDVTSRMFRVSTSNISPNATDR